MRKILLAVAAVSASPIAAQNIAGPPTYASVKAQAVPVTAGDITDRPYRIVGRIDMVVTKFAGHVDRAKVYRELWKKGRRMGADAVINAQYGEARADLENGGRNAGGDAIKFLTDAEIAALPAKS